MGEVETPVGFRCHGLAVVPTLPTGTATCLFTDLEDSTRRGEAHPEAMPDVLVRLEHGAAVAYLRTEANRVLDQPID